ncbi:hypothetical protein N7925_07225 [Streptomyces sp. CA-278952]|uniref:hypothetical protein n=1 Tax=Streptomyces sp. CA-278952 TaxID=2980556 RepID=UPI0023685AA4|nr:hypothetical protein [Streptomyces sp. CA-278952]WDG28144.1 hypothetical protein N7925_07225 [Streptomyces sp. CA-278952]
MEFLAEISGVADLKNYWNDVGVNADSAWALAAFTPFGKIKGLPKGAITVKGAITGSRAYRPILKWTRADGSDGWGHVQSAHRTGGKEWLEDPSGKGVLEGKFVRGERLKKRIQEAVGQGNVSANTQGRTGIVYERNFGPSHPTGKVAPNRGGHISTTIRVVLDANDGAVVTAHPVQYCRSIGCRPEEIPPPGGTSLPFDKRLLTTRLLRAEHRVHP